PPGASTIGLGSTASGRALLGPDLGEERALFPRKLAVLEEIGAPREGASERLLEAVSGDLLVVPRTEHLRDAPPTELPGARVLRVLEEAPRVALLLGGERVAEHAGDEPRRGLDDREGRDLPAEEDEVAEGDLLVDLVPDALVEALVAAADQH